MMTMLYLLPIVIGLWVENPPTVIGSPNNKDLSWINEPSVVSVINYVGRFHEYPANEQVFLEWLDYYDRAVFPDYTINYKKGIISRGGVVYTAKDNVFGDNDFYNLTMLQNSLRSRKVIDQLIRKKKCIFLDSMFIVSTKKKNYFVIGNLSDWLINSQYDLMHYYKPAFYDWNGQYLIELSESEEFHEEMEHFSMRFRNRFLFLGNRDSFPQPINRTFRVRVKYMVGGDVCLAEEMVIPESIYLSDDVSKGICVKKGLVSTFTFDEMINVFKPFFQDYIRKHPEVNSIDCLIPLCLPIESTEAQCGDMNKIES